MRQLSKADKAVFIINDSGELIYADEQARTLISETDVAERLSAVADGSSSILLSGRGAEVPYSVTCRHIQENGIRVIIFEDVCGRSELIRLASIGSIMPSIAHEMRNPLTGISVLLDDIHDRLTGKEDERRLIRMSIAEIERLERMLNDALVYSGGGSSVMFDENIGDILSEVLMLNHKLCTVNRIEVHGDISPDIPEILADGGKLRQAFHNLIINAVEAMPGGGNLTLSAYVSDGKINIHIKDTGYGIAEEKLHMIFEPFFTDKSEGSGIGLSVVREIIRMHGGEISVRSEIGKGTDFCITLNI